MRVRHLLETGYGDADCSHFGVLAPGVAFLLELAGQHALMQAAFRPDFGEEALAAVAVEDYGSRGCSVAAVTGFGLGRQSRRSHLCAQHQKDCFEPCRLDVSFLPSRESPPRDGKKKGKRCANWAPTGTRSNSLKSKQSMLRRELFRAQSLMFR